MFKRYLQMIWIPLLSMAGGIGISWFMVIWVQHECYNRYLETPVEILVQP